MGVKLNQNVLSWESKMIIKKRFGFTFIEIIVVVALIGIILISSYPSILNIMETRSLEGEARELLTTLETARYTAANEKVPCRIRFFQKNYNWHYLIEIEIKNIDKNETSWQSIPKFQEKTLPRKFNPQLQLPDDKTIVFSPLGMVANYDFNSTQNHRIILQSQKLKNYAKEDLRIINIYAGGSIGYIKAKSQG